VKWTFTRPDGSEASFDASRAFVEWLEPGCILRREEAIELRPANAPALEDLRKAVRAVMEARTTIERARALGSLAALLEE
jgi:hypothetical protein